MSHLSKIVSLVATVVLFARGIALAADPTKVPPKLPATKTPPAKFARPDLVPKKKWSRGQLVTGLEPSCVGNKLHVQVSVMNTGTATAGSFKTVVSVNGAVWDVGNNPLLWAPGLAPGEGFSLTFSGYSPGYGPIPGKVLVSVQVDSENTVPEVNENNNVATVTTHPCK